jgi:hypothetical protein
LKDDHRYEYVYTFLFKNDLFYTRIFTGSSELNGKISLAILLGPLDFVLIFWFWYIPYKSKKLLEQVEKMSGKKDKKNCELKKKELPNNVDKGV